MQFSGLRMAINYGINRVRFVSPVPAGVADPGAFRPSRSRTRRAVFQVTWQATIDREHTDKPAASPSGLSGITPRER